MVIENRAWKWSQVLSVNDGQHFLRNDLSDYDGNSENVLLLNSDCSIFGYSMCSPLLRPEKAFLWEQAYWRFLVDRLTKIFVPTVYEAMAIQAFVGEAALDKVEIVGFPSEFIEDDVENAKRDEAIDGVTPKVNKRKIFLGHPDLFKFLVLMELKEAVAGDSTFENWTIECVFSDKTYGFLNVDIDFPFNTEFSFGNEYVEIDSTYEEGGFIQKSVPEFYCRSWDEAIHESVFFGQHPLVPDYGCYKEMFLFDSIPSSKERYAFEKDDAKSAVDQLCRVMTGDIKHSPPLFYLQDRAMGDPIQLVQGVLNEEANRS